MPVLSHAIFVSESRFHPLRSVSLPGHAHAIAAIRQQSIEYFVSDRVGFGCAQYRIVVRGLCAHQRRDARGDPHVPILVRAKRVAAIVSDRRQLKFQRGERRFSLRQLLPGDDGREIIYCAGGSYARRGAIWSRMGTVGTAARPVVSSGVASDFFMLSASTAPPPFLRSCSTREL
jgi:hypothetical protein